MNAESTFAGRELYLRHTDKSGKSHVMRHRVWDAERFLNSAMDAARKEGGHVAVATEEEFLQERRK